MKKNNKREIEVLLGSFNEVVTERFIGKVVFEQTLERGKGANHSLVESIPDIRNNCRRLLRSTLK